MSTSARREIHKATIIGRPVLLFHLIIYSINIIFFSLKDRDLDWIKQFLLGYGAVRRRENYNVIADYCAPFYDALCAGAVLSSKPRDAPGTSYVTSLFGTSTL
jgi:hypothetical protein